MARISLRDIDEGTLPAVSFYKPAGRLNQHPSYTDLMSGDAHIADLLERLNARPQWNDMLVVVTYDENGGFWDHVPPPTGPGWGDRLGPATRIPALIVSPFAKRGFVDHTTYDTTSIIKFLTARFDLEPLPGVREKMGDLTAALNLPLDLAVVFKKACACVCRSAVPTPRREGTRSCAARWWCRRRPAQAGRRSVEWSEPLCPGRAFDLSLWQSPSLKG